MSDGEIRAREVISGGFGRLVWRGGKLETWEPLADSTGETNRLWLAPPLLDAQVNGFAGVDFQQEDLVLADFERAARCLVAAGGHRFLPTLITDAWPAMLRQLRQLRRLREQSADLARIIPGWHVEGPFLSSEPGYCGAHVVEHMIDPSPERVRELREAAGDDRVLLTLAPERRGSLEAIALAVSLGMTVSLGHTNATWNRLRDAHRAGARGFTHLGNGCPQQLDRHDNVLWRVLETEGLMVSLIPDRIHVSPPLFRILHRALPNQRICYVTDAMAAAGAAPGRYRLGRMELEVGEDRIVRKPGSQFFAGSALSPIEVPFRAAEMLGGTWQEAWGRFSLAPARLLGLAEPWQRGQPADFCLWEVDAQNRPLRGTRYEGGMARVLEPPDLR